MIIFRFALKKYLILFCLLNLDYKVIKTPINLHKYFHPSFLNQLLYAQCTMHKCNAESQKDQQKVPILKKTSGLSPSISNYSLHIFVCRVLGKTRLSNHAYYTHTNSRVGRFSVLKLNIFM